MPTTSTRLVVAGAITESVSNMQGLLVLIPLIMATAFNMMSMLALEWSAHNQVRLPFSALLLGPLFKMVCMISLFSSSPNSGRVGMSWSSVSIPECGAVCWGVGVTACKEKSH